MGYSIWQAAGKFSETWEYWSASRVSELNLNQFNRSNQFPVWYALREAVCYTPIDTIREHYRKIGKVWLTFLSKIVQEKINDAITVQVHPSISNIVHGGKSLVRFKPFFDEKKV